MQNINTDLEGFCLLTDTYKIVLVGNDIILTPYIFEWFDTLWTKLL